MRYITRIIRSLQLIILATIHTFLLFIWFNLYTVLQTGTSFAYILVTLMKNKEIKYMTVCLIFMVNLVLSILIWTLQSINTYDIIVTAGLSWGSVLFTVVLDVIHTYFIEHDVKLFRVNFYKLVKSNTVSNDVCINVSPECPVCFESVIVPYYQTNCQHPHCKYCLDTWLEKNTTCPVCRTILYVCN